MMRVTEGAPMGVKDVYSDTQHFYYSSRYRAAVRVIRIDPGSTRINNHCISLCVPLAQPELHFLKCRNRAKAQNQTDPPGRCG